MGKQIQIRRKLVLIAFMGISAILKSQVYNYEPIRHYNFETNPAYMASGKINMAVSATHTGSFFEKNKFYSDAAKFSIYSKQYLAGLGLVINNTHLNDSTNYSYAAIGGAYRTVLFNKIHTDISFLTLHHQMINAGCQKGRIQRVCMSTIRNISRK